VHEVVISPFLGDYLAVRPGARNGVRLPQVMYADACQADTCLCTVIQDEDDGVIRGEHVRA
jgi:hypothetical protein